MNSYVETPKGGQMQNSGSGSDPDDKKRSEQIIPRGAIAQNDAALLQARLALLQGRFAIGIAVLALMVSLIALFVRSR